MPQVKLSREELLLLNSALDSHEYWQLTEPDKRNDGASQVPDGASPEIDKCRALSDKIRGCFMADGQSKKTLGQLLIDAAEAHGQDSEPDHEVGDLQDVVRSCFEEMSPEQARRVFYKHEELVE